MCCMQVLKLLGVRKQRPRYQPSDPRVSKRRLYGSLSSLPSSVSSRPVPVQQRRRHGDRKKVRDFEVSLALKIGGGETFDVTIGRGHGVIHA